MSEPRLAVVTDVTGRRVLPHNLEAERAVLGGILVHPKAFSEVLEHVSAGDFYHPTHRAIFEAMVDCDNASKPIDPITVAEQMRALDTFKALRIFDGEAYFAELTAAVLTVENISYYAKLVRDKATVRKLIEVATEIAGRGYGDYGEVGEFLESAERRIFEVAQQATISTGPESQKKILRTTIDTLEARYDRKQAITGVPSGFAQLDALTSGFQPRDLVIIAGRPGTGKTALVMGIVENAAVLYDVPALVFSLEMSKESLMERALAAEGRVDSTSLRTGFLSSRDWVGVTVAASRISEAPVQIDDSGALTLLEIRAKCRRWRADPKVFPKGGELQHGIVVIDYLQLIAGRGGDDSRRREQSREREIAEISGGLKALAKELRLPVVALSQLNRSVESRKDRRPGLGDLRESGAIEQDADLIAFVYRDEIYNKDSPDKGIAEVIIGKQRNGPTGTARLRFIPSCTRFENLPGDGA